MFHQMQEKNQQTLTEESTNGESGGSFAWESHISIETSETFSLVTKAPEIRSWLYHQESIDTMLYIVTSIGQRG